jgi:hypothetical protein
MELDNNIKDCKKYIYYVLTDKNIYCVGKDKNVFPLQESKNNIT